MKFSYALLNMQRKLKKLGVYDSRSERKYSIPSMLMINILLLVYVALELWFFFNGGQ